MRQMHLLIAKCHSNERNDIPRPIIAKTLPKLSLYEQLICTDMAEHAWILDPRFSNDFIADHDVLRKYVTLDNSSERNNPAV